MYLHIRNSGLVHEHRDSWLQDLTKPAGVGVGVTFFSRFTPFLIDKFLDFDTESCSRMPLSCLNPGQGQVVIVLI